MSGTMSREDLATDLLASLSDVAEQFGAPLLANFMRLLDLAAQDFSRVTALRKVGSFNLVPGVASYAAPADIQDIGAPLWGKDPRPSVDPWDEGYPRQFPSLIYAAGDGALQLSIAPTASEIGACGSVYKFTYYAAHVLSTDSALTTIKPRQRGLLILRAQAEAMKEIAIRNVRKPVQMRDGVSGTPRNGTPAFLYQALMNEFEMQGGVRSPETRT